MKNVSRLKEQYRNKRKTDQQTKNLKLFLKTGNGPKNEETDPKKKEETDQQTENLKLFLKTGNGPKKEETDPKKRGNGPKKRGNGSTN